VKVVNDPDARGTAQVTVKPITITLTETLTVTKSDGDEHRRLVMATVRGVDGEALEGISLRSSFVGNNDIVNYSGTGTTDSNGNASWLIEGENVGSCDMHVQYMNATEIESNRCVITVGP
jgi:hypothetical protein